jgi:SAM-dependent methyltransferase
VSASSFPAQEIKSSAWALYEATDGATAERNILDVCCGVGTLAEHFLSHGYAVTGIDLSEPMLAIARQKLDGYLQGGQARLIQADAASFWMTGSGWPPAPSTLSTCSRAARPCQVASPASGARWPRAGCSSST